MTAYYNEIDPFAAAWLRELIKAGHIAPGDVDTRSIVDVRPDDLRKYTQCHFFAGIGVWSYALRRAGWPDDRPIWTGSCPCQPFSSAGKGGGFADERHLWPFFHYLIRECGPAVVAGEQVASKDGLAWLDLVQADMEGTGYAFGAVDTCAAGFGAPHIRQRLYWLAEGLDDATSTRHVGAFGNTEGATWHETQLRMSGVGKQIGGLDITPGSGRERLGDKPEHSQPLQTVEDTGGVGDAVSSGRQPKSDVFGSNAERVEQTGGIAEQSGKAGAYDGRLADCDSDEQRQGQGPVRSASETSEPGGLADSQSFGRGEQCSHIARCGERSGPEGLEQRLGGGGVLNSLGGTSPTNGFWRDADWLFCRDGRWRPVEPGTFPLAHGAAARVGRLRGYGNAINAEQAQGFIKAFIETEAERFRLTSLYDPVADVETKTDRTYSDDTPDP